MKEGGKLKEEKKNNMEKIICLKNKFFFLKLKIENKDRKNKKNKKSESLRREATSKLWCRLMGRIINFACVDRYK